MPVILVDIMDNGAFMLALRSGEGGSFEVPAESWPEEGYCKMEDSFCPVAELLTVAPAEDPEITFPTLALVANILSSVPPVNTNIVWDQVRAPPPNHIAWKQSW